MANDRIYILWDSKTNDFPQQTGGVHLFFEDEADAKRSFDNHEHGGAMEIKDIDKQELYDLIDTEARR